MHAHAWPRTPPHTCVNSGDWVPLTNYLHPCHSDVSAEEKLYGPVGGGWLSGRSENWVRGHLKPTLSLLKANRVTMWTQEVQVCFRHSIFERCVFLFMWGWMCWTVKASVPDSRERIRGLECKTLLDPGATFEAKSLAHICPSWVMIQLVAPLECWPLMHLVTQCALNISIHQLWGHSQPSWITTGRVQL